MVHDRRTDRQTDRQKDRQTDGWPDVHQQMEKRTGGKSDL